MDELRIRLGDLAAAARILEREGHGSRTLGHVAMRDPQGRGFWIKVRGIGLGEVHGADNFVLADFDGHALTAGALHREWPMHAAVFRARPDVHYTGHTHPLHGRIFSAVDAPLPQVSSNMSYFADPPPRFALTSELVDTPDLGAAMAHCLGGHAMLFLRNHGVFFCGPDVATFTVYGVALEEACREALLLAASGLPAPPPPREELDRKARDLGSPAQMQQYWDFLLRQHGRP